MAKKKSKFDLATERAAAILQEHFDSLPEEVAKQKRAEFHRLTVEMSRGSRGKVSRVPRTSGIRRKSQSSAKPA
jgi:hypothetical protein